MVPPVGLTQRIYGFILKQPEPEQAGKSKENRAIPQKRRGRRSSSAALWLDQDAGEILSVTRFSYSAPI